MTDTMEPETFTAGLRRRLEADRWRCPTCHQPTGGGGVRGLAELIGVNHATLWRFLRGGDMTGRNIDLVVAFLDRRDADLISRVLHPVATPALGYWRTEIDAMGRGVRVLEAKIDDDGSPG